MEKTKHIGDVGTRVEIVGRVLCHELVEHHYGASCRIKLENDDGVLAWWLSSNWELAHSLQAGQILTVRATIMRYVLAEDRLWVQIRNGRILENALALI
jgi:hypothetical protein